jgi:hypothetical protein
LSGQLLQVAAQSLDALPSLRQTRLKLLFVEHTFGIDINQSADGTLGLLQLPNERFAPRCIFRRQLQTSLILLA